MGSLGEKNNTYVRPSRRPQAKSGVPGLCQDLPASHHAMQVQLLFRIKSSIEVLIADAKGFYIFTLFMFSTFFAFLCFCFKFLLFKTFF